MEKICFTGVFISFFCLMCVRAQIEFSPRAGATVLDTRNLEPRHVGIIDGVTKMHYDNPLPNFIGSPYMEEEFKEGIMKALDGTLIRNLKFRYDIFEDRMELLINQDTAIITWPEAIEYVQIEDRKFQYEVFLLVKDIVATGYFEILYEGDFISALCQRRIKLEKDEYVVNYGGGGGTKALKMKQVKHLFVKPENSAAREIERKKDLISVLPEYEYQISTFLKENRISLKREDDFYRIVEYMDRLIKGI